MAARAGLAAEWAEPAETVAAAAAMAAADRAGETCASRPRAAVLAA